MQRLPRAAVAGAGVRLNDMATLLCVAIHASGCNGSTTGPDGGGVRERWFQLQPGWSWARPAVAGDVVYFGTGDGQIIARDVNNGRPVWSAKVANQPVNGANVLVRNGVVIAPIVSHTVGLDASTGRELWRYLAPLDTVGISPGVPGQVATSRIDADDARVFIPAWGASVSAVDIRTGATRWTWQPGRMEGDTAASGVFRSGSNGVRVSGDTVFATVWHNVNRLGGTVEGWVVALDRASGREFWRVRLPREGGTVRVGTAPALYANLVIARTLHGRVYAIDRVTHEVVWKFHSTDATLSTVAGVEVYGDVLYADGGDSHLYALRAGTGEVVWKSPFPTQSGADLLVTDRRVTFTNGPDLFVVDRETGRRIATTSQPRTHDPLFSSPAAYANGLVFVTVGDGAWCFEQP